MNRRTAALLAIAGLAVLASVSPAGAIGPPCKEALKAKCFGVEKLEASLSTTKAGAHPDFTYSFGIAQDPESKPDNKGLHNVYAPTRNVRFEAPPGLIGDPSVLGEPQLCSPVELSAEQCPNGSQIGIAEINLYNFNSVFREPIYMMTPPGGDVVARVGFIAGVAIPVYANFMVRSESDYGLTGEITDAASAANLVEASATLWGVPADASHDRERCTPNEVFAKGCIESPLRDPGGKELPFLTNPTRCGIPLSFKVNASSWVEPELDPEKAVEASLPAITGCNELPFGPRLTIKPTSRRAGAPTGLDITATLLASEVKVREPSHTRDVRVLLPEGLSVNSSAADGLEVCSEDQVKFTKRVAAECPEAAKLAEFEALIPALPRRLKGALYLREPEPGNLFRVWIVADDLGAHVKLQGQLHVDEQTGQIETVLLDAPQAPLREVKIVLKSGFRAPLVNPPACGTYTSRYEFTPWSGGLPVIADSSMQIDEGCEGQGSFAPKITAGSTNPTAGEHSPFVFRLTREDDEQNPASLEVTLPRGLSAKIAGVPRCEGAAAATGGCAAASRIGKVIAAAGAGPTPLWLPQPGKRPTAVYLGGPYKGAPLSVIAVVPAEAGPFDLGDQVVRSAIFLDPATAQGTVRSDPLPQIIEGVPIRYRTVQVELDREDFTLNPTGCEPKSIEGRIVSTQGASAHPSAPYTAINCSRLGFKPRLDMRLFGGTTRGAHPAFRAIVRPRAGDSNIKAAVMRLPRSAFLDQDHIRTVCTRVQYAAKQCPAGSVYGHVKAFTPLLDEPLEGPVYLRSSSNLLPDLVFSLRGLVDVEAVGRIDSVNGGIRSTFDAIADAPISKVVLNMQGGKKGLIENSRNLCVFKGRVVAQLTAHNGRKRTLRPALRAVSCGKR